MNVRLVAGPVHGREYHALKNHITSIAVAAWGLGLVLYTDTNEFDEDGYRIFEYAGLNK